MAILLRLPLVLIILMLFWVSDPIDAVSEASSSQPHNGEALQLRWQINFVAKNRRRTPNPPGWEEYDGSPYTKERGYGWLTDMVVSGWDGGGHGEMILPDGAVASPIALGRLELANWQGTHQENLPLVFRIDLPDGWYRVTCTSVDPDNAPLPLVDKRSIKFRAHDAVFAGSPYGLPLQIAGNRLIEGSGLVEVTEGHLRIVVGDPAYGGWTWSFEGPWYQGWRSWFGRLNHQRYAVGWYHKLTRRVDPGFHSLRFNSLVVERAMPPAEQKILVFREFLNRDDSPDINAGVPGTDRWAIVPLDPSLAENTHVDLYRTSIRVTGSPESRRMAALIQEKKSPPRGIIRYSTRVSLFTGEGSKIYSGAQEAGLFILGEPGAVSEFSSTFIGVAFDSKNAETSGGIVLRVGNGLDGFKANQRIWDTSLPFRIVEGEYAIVVDHDVEGGLLSHIQINGVDITNFFSLSSRTLPVSTGVFGMRSVMDPRGTGVKLQHYYWYYHVEVL